MKKKMLILGLTLLLAVGLPSALTACGGGGGDPAATTHAVPDTALEEYTEPATQAAATDGAVTEAVTEPETREDTETETLGDTEAVTEPETRPEAAPDEVSAAYKHIVIVGVDGAGAFFQEADTPNLDEIFANGAVTYEGITATPSISAQAWGSLLHGVTPEFHGLDNGITGTRAYPMDSEFPSFFRVVREQMPEASLASFCNWNNINVGIIEDSIGVHKVHETSDVKVIRAAESYVRQEVENGNGAPTLLFLQLDEADHAGHSAGYGTATHLRMIRQQDSWIRLLYDAYAELGLLEDTLFIVTADHGGLGNGHGGSSDAEMKIMFAAAGRTVEQGTIGEMGIRDTASIVLYALGLAEHQPKAWTSRVPSGLFRGVVAGERPVYVIDGSNRQHENQPTPEAGSAEHISGFITDRELLHYLTFDGDGVDEMGAATETHDKLYYVEGYFGEAVSLVDGHVSLPNYAPGRDSFSVSLWVNTKGVSSDPCLFSNKNWSNGYLEGYVLSLKPGTLLFNMGDGTNRMDFSRKLPLDYATGWMHVTLVVDREAAEVRISIDFGAFQSMAIPEDLKDASLDAYEVLNIGQDGRGIYAVPLSAAVDEFMLFDGALTDADLAKLAEYYGK